MNSVWNPETYDRSRRRLVPCFDAFYGTVSELIVRTAPVSASSSGLRVLDLGAGTGLLSEQVLARVRGRERDVSLTLLDGSAAMLERASRRLAGTGGGRAPRVVVADFAAPLPAGEFDVIMSALAIHHLDDAGKRDLFARVHAALAPGGVFINAEQVCGADEREQALFEAAHLDGARALGSSESEIAEAVERMRIDRCATLDAQVGWLADAGFARSGAFFHWFRFAVYAGWKAS